jgi:hypothetical protein
LNDPFLHQCAQRLAVRIVRSSVDDGERIDLACRLLFGRSATAADRADAAEFLSAFAAQSTDRNQPEFMKDAWTAYARVLLGSNEFLHVD